MQSFYQVVKRVADNFVGATVCLFVVVPSEIGPNTSFSLFVSVFTSGEMSGRLSAIVTSSV